MKIDKLLDIVSKMNKHNIKTAPIDAELLLDIYKTCASYEKQIAELKLELAGRPTRTTPHPAPIFPPPSRTG